MRAGSSSRRSRARGRPCAGTAARATSCSRSAITTSRCWRDADDGGRRRRACGPGSERLSGAGRRLPRRRRAAARATASSSPASSTRPRYLERAGRAGAARPRRGRAAPAPRRRHAPTTLRADARATTWRLFAEHGHLSRDAGRAARATRSSTATGAWPTRAATAAGAASTTSSRCCSRPAATPTSPSRPRPTSASRAIVNQIYWPDGDLARRRAYEQGERARVGDAARRSHPDDRGAAGARAAARGGCSRRASRTPRSPPTIRRRRRACAPGSRRTSTSPGRPEWVFVKVHTHGAPEAQAASLLGDGGRALHRELTPGTTTAQRWRAALRDRARDVQHRARRDGRAQRRPERVPRLRPAAAADRARLTDSDLAFAFDCDL